MERDEASPSLNQAQRLKQEYRLTMIGQLRHPVTMGTDVFGNLQRMDNYMETLPVKEQTCRERLSDLETQMEIAKIEVQQSFPREEDLKTKTARLEKLNSLLNLDHREPEIMDTIPDEAVQIPPRPPCADGAITTLPLIKKVQNGILIKTGKGR